MWTFQYKHGDRPLDGFTIQRAAGRGGFGEVYYAVSDSGREVALKAVTGYEQIEVRGISQCMNLKSPHLVTIFDVKYNDMGKPFVIMEFVGGPNLRQLMDESPAGLGTQKTAFFLREIGKGLTFLHDCGIVHRDLKPANVFFENGYVKIGDYGLSKAISPTQHSGQTVTVGTVHYMAPEVGAGKYDRSIDIYAMGAVLYEMLTGTVPFIGASPSEILIKHLQAEPDCGEIPEPFCTVIKKAMAKDPGQRYASVQEMVEGVFGAEHVRMSVSHFSPDDLSVVAGRVAQKVGIGPSSAGVGGGAIGGGGSSSVVGGENIGAGIRNRFEETGQRLRDGVDRIHNRFAELRGDPNANAGASGNTRAEPADELGINDPLSMGSRFALGLLAAVVVSIAMGALADSSSIGSLQPITVPVFVFTAICGASFGLLFGWRRIAIRKLSQESAGVRKLVVAMITCGTMLLCSGCFWLIMVNQGPFHNATLLAILVPLSVFNTWEWARANREERVSLVPPLVIGTVGALLAGLFHGESMLAFALLAGISLAVQVMAPWDPVFANERKFRVKSKMRGATTDPREAVVSGSAPVSASFKTASDQVYANANIGSTGISFSVPSSKPRKITRPVWPFAPAMWLILTILLFSGGLTAAIVAGNSGGVDSDMLGAMGACGIVNAVICFIFIFKRRYVSIWTYIVRPLLLMGCIDSIVVFGVIASNEDMNGGCIFAIVFSCAVLIALPFLRFDRNFGAAAPVIPPPIPPVDTARSAPPMPPQPPTNDAPIPPVPPIDPPLWPRTTRQWGRWRRVNRAQRLRNKKGFAAILSSMLIFSSVVLMVAIGLDLPLAISLGLPDSKTAHDIRTQFIGDYSNWNVLATKLLYTAELLSVVMAITVALMARAGSNFLHLLRAVVGIVGLILAAAFVTGKFHADEAWPMVANQVALHQNGEAIDTIITHFQNPASIFGAILFVISMVILSIPPRKQPTPPKGVA